MKTKLLGSLLLLAVWATPSHATLMEVSGAFSGTAANDNIPGVTYTLAGNFTYRFDDALIPTTGFYSLDNQPLASLWLSGPVGNTTFDLSNTALRLDWIDGALIFVGLGDVGDVTSAGSGRDDFTVLLANGSNPFYGMFYSLAAPSNFFGFNYAINASLSVAPVGVPETGSPAALAGLALAGLVLLRVRLRAVSR